jgi:hypothetical protein
MNVVIGAEAALFPDKEYIKGIFVAVQVTYPDGIAQRKKSTVTNISHLGTLTNNF